MQNFPGKDNQGSNKTAGHLQGKAAVSVFLALGVWTISSSLLVCLMALSWSLVTGVSLPWGLP